MTEERSGEGDEIEVSVLHLWVGEVEVRRSDGKAFWERRLGRVLALSSEVIQWRTRTENRISMLQHMRQIQPGSPFSTITTVRFTTLETRVQQLPAKVRRATVRAWELRLFL